MCVRELFFYISRVRYGTKRVGARPLVNYIVGRRCHYALFPSSPGRYVDRPLVRGEGEQLRPGGRGLEPSFRERGFTGPCNRVVRNVYRRDYVDSDAVIESCEIIAGRYASRALRLSGRELRPGFFLRREIADGRVHGYKVTGENEMLIFSTHILEI